MIIKMVALNGGGVSSKDAPKVGRIDVYKVHHHGSRHSTNETWLQTTRPTAPIISTGDPNSYGHPTGECLERPHTAEIRTYWTSAGQGVPPDPAFDVVGGNIVVEAEPGSTTFTVTYSGSRVDTFSSADAGPIVAVAPAGFAWSVKSSVYH